MKIIEHDQGSKAWKLWRTTGVTATDISVLTGSNKWKTPLQLWEYKCGFREEDPPNQAMMHGRDNEDPVRQEIMEKHSLDLKPHCVQGSKVHYLASLDGFDEKSGTLVEIKCPVSSKVLKACREGNIPEYWKDQVLWQSYITGAKKAFFGVFDYEEGKINLIPFPIDVSKFSQMELLADEFWNHVQTGLAPEPQKDDCVEIEDAQLRELLLAYQNESEQEKSITARKKAIKKQIEEFGDDGNFAAYGFKVVRMQPRTSYDMDRMKEDGIDIDKYKKDNNSIGYYRIISPRG